MSAKFKPHPSRFGQRPGHGILSLVALSGLMFASTPCWAVGCELALVQTPTAVVINYNPFVVGPSSAGLDVRLENRGDDVCDARFSFADDAGSEVGSLVLGGVGLQVRARETAGLLTPDLAPGVFKFMLAPHTIGEAQFDFSVVVDGVPEAGEHSADLQLLTQNFDRTALLPSMPVRVTLLSTPRAQLNLAGAAGAFGSNSSVEVVDFGEAVTGATRRIFVQMRANTPSTLTIKSEHGGVMARLADDEITTTSTVPYRVELDGAEVDLSTLWARQVDPARTLAGTSLPMTFTLGTVSGQMAGRYQDLLTVDISPN